jgi:hypothetical protein
MVVACQLSILQGTRALQTACSDRRLSTPNFHPRLTTAAGASYQYPNQRRLAMAINMALKRARKAAHRKQMAAQKRRVELLEASLPARVLRSAEAPIQHCLLTKSLFEDGIGTLILARGSISLHMGSFLLDTFCLGIKDVVFKQMDAEDFETYVDAFDAAAGMTSVDPSYARKLLRELAAWSQTIGFAPHRELAAVERNFRRDRCRCERRGLSLRPEWEALLYSWPSRYRFRQPPADRTAAEIRRRRWLRL